MKVSLSWLRDYVDLGLEPDDLAHRLTMAGLEVEGVERIGEGWGGCLVGLVQAVEPHPNADRLRLCTVDLGGDRLQVVCGAPNVAQGQRVAFARVGARLLDAHSGRLETLKAARIRGVLSEGMVCSALELGLGDDHTGILVLPGDAPVGAALSDYLGDAILDLSVTANRPDGLSMLGVAHEVAAIQGGQARQPDSAYPELGEPVESLVSVTIQDPEQCPRYLAALVTGVRVGPSPLWMQQRLARAGMRPISNVVDVTNYVMLEYGQPLHAFDLRRLKGRRVVVREARRGERLVTLDGVERSLEPPMLAIADAEDAVAVAGVMGGAGSEVTGGTTDVLLESASFHPFNTRRTAASLRLRTEASLRFEKGLRPELPPLALRRAVRLLLEVAGGTAARGVLDVYPGRRTPAPLLLTPERVRRVLGADVPVAQTSSALTSLGFQCRAEGPEALRVSSPPWRADIGRVEDLVEEVARVIGYDRFPTVALSAPIPHHQPDPLREGRELARDTLAAAGLQEVVTYSLVSGQALEETGSTAQGDPRPLRVVNPLSPELEFLRTTLRPGLLRALAANQRHAHLAPLWLFEVGRVYLPSGEGLPQERETAAAIVAGPPTATSWLGGLGDAGFYDAKGLVEALLERLGVLASFQPLEEPFFQAGRAALVVAGGRGIGRVGEVQSPLLERMDIQVGRVALMEIDLQAAVESGTPPAGRVRTGSPYPGALRDLAVTVDAVVPAGRVRQVLEGHPLVAHASLFDVYSGPQVGGGRRSLAYRLLFQRPDRTLTAEEVASAMEGLLKQLGEELGAVQRA